MNLFSTAWNFLFSSRGADKQQYANGPYNSGAGVTVTEEVALAQSACYSAIRVLTDAFTVVPMKIYNTSGAINTLDATSSTARVLGVSPNRRMTSQDFWPYIICSLNLRGRAYARKVFRPDGQLMRLIPILPDFVEVEVTEIESYRFTINEPDRDREVLTDKDVFWVNGLMLDGKHPLTPLEYQSKTIGRSAAAGNFENNIYEKDGLPKLALTAPGKLGREVRQRIADAWKAQAKGGIPVLEEGVAPHTLNLSPADVALIEQKQFTVEDIARFYRVPPSMLYIEKTAKGWTTLEMQAQEFVTYSLLPWAEKIEGAIGMQLLKSGQIAQFDFERLLRGNLLNRITAYRQGIGSGIYTPNEVRAKENLPPYEGGNVHTMNGSTITVDSLQNGQGVGNQEDQ